MKKSKKIRTTYPLVSEPIEVNTTGNFSTLNFEMFNILNFNRGVDNGIDPVRVNKFRKLHEKGEYYLDIIHLYVNKKMEVIDGNHKLKLHSDLNLPINFTVLTQEEFNTDDVVKKLGAVARFNAINSKWDGKAHFNTALNLNLPLAINIQNLKAEYDEKYGLDGRILTPSRIFALISYDKLGLGSKLVTVEDYAKTELCNVLKTEKFVNEFNFVCTIIKELQDWNVIYEETAKLTPFNMVRAAMPSVWDNELNINKFLNIVQETKFKNVSNTVKGCLIYTKKIQKRILGL